MWASACWSSFGSATPSPSRSRSDGSGGRGAWLARAGGSGGGFDAGARIDSGEIVGARGAITPLDVGALAASAASGSETRGGSGAFGFRGETARAPAGGI